MVAVKNNYRIGRHARRKSKKYVWLTILAVVLLLIGFAGFMTYQIIQDSEAEISLPAPVTHEYEQPDASDVVLDQEEFTIKLPEDWRLRDHSENNLHNRYTFQATAQGKDNRTLEVYVDRVPADKAFNRLLPVIVVDNRVTVISSVSGNCTEFTGDQGEDRQRRPSGPPVMDAKWQNISFKCDMANYVRNVVGVGTAESGHLLELTGPTMGSRTFYIVYIDHNINPDYQILERALESLTVK